MREGDRERERKRERRADILSDAMLARSQWSVILEVMGEKKILSRAAEQIEQIPQNFNRQFFIG
jgi:hypothetical protein